MQSSVIVSSKSINEEVKAPSTDGGESVRD